MLVTSTQILPVTGSLASAATARPWLFPLCAGQTRSPVALSTCQSFCPLGSIVRPAQTNGLGGGGGGGGGGRGGSWTEPTSHVEFGSGAASMSAPSVATAAGSQRTVMVVKEVGAKFRPSTTPAAETATVFWIGQTASGRPGKFWSVSAPGVFGGADDGVVGVVSLGSGWLAGCHWLGQQVMPSQSHGTAGAGGT
eukprot:SAG22_NODE_56_length_23716_cov_11.146759_7_plen_195_part_00